MRSKGKVLKTALPISWKGRNLISPEISAVFSIKYLPPSSQQYCRSQTITSLLPVYEPPEGSGTCLRSASCPVNCSQRAHSAHTGTAVVWTHSVTGVTRTTEGLLLIQRRNWELSKAKWWFYHKAEQFLLLHIETSYITSRLWKVLIMLIWGSGKTSDLRSLN